MRSPSTFSTLFSGQITYLSHGFLKGWALSNQALRERTRQDIWLHVLVDGQEIERIPCNLLRPEEAAHYHLPSPYIGFEWKIPDAFYDGQKRAISLRFPDRSILPFPAHFLNNQPSNDDLSEEWIFEGREEIETRSYFEGLQDGQLKGWIAQRKGLNSPWKGEVTLDLTVDGRPLTRLKANQQRADVAHSLEKDNFSKIKPASACGFSYSLPHTLRDGAYHEFKVTIVPENIEISGSPIRTKYLEDSMGARIAHLNNMIDALQNQLTHLRREALSLMPQSYKFSIDDYNRWYESYRKTLTAKTKRQRQLNPLQETPLLSIICPVFHPEPQHFSEAIQSIEQQTYANWNLLLVLDGPQKKKIETIAQKASQNDSRISLLSLAKQQGISKATNRALKQAKGEYILFLDHDDLFDPNALEIMVRAALETKADILYSDEDKLSPEGIFNAPHLKPDFNYRYLLGCNYICHLSMYRRSLLEQVGALKKEYDGAQDHDLLLRAYEISPNGFHHVPEILYHWRQTPKSTALSSENKTYAKNSGAKAVQHHLIRQKYKAKVKPIANITLYQTEWVLPQKRPSVTVIIPFRDQSLMTKTCVDSFLKTQTYTNFSILLVDNWSIEDETKQFLKEISKHKKVSVLRIEEDFNFARLNNLAAEKASGEYLLFLNNDVEVMQKDFLLRMMGEMLNLPKAGAVGARLLYPSKALQHGGVAVSPKAIAIHMHRGRDENDLGYMGRARLNQEVSAVTGAALLTSKALFLEIGEFNEKDFPIAYNDVDFCLRLRQKGYKIYYCGDTVAIHHESLSRGSDEIAHNERRLFEETQNLLARWQDVPFFQKDPFYPQNFLLEGETFHQLASPLSSSDNL
ncbi:glycosyltransferase family 2 protein [Acetobacteraceae bacterium]|nr:glycosyltransferase family 2 protein [Acetobacteraceae bacterium]